MIDLDRYTLNARILPALLAVAPAAASVLAWIDVETDPWKWGGVTVVAATLGFYLAQVTRDAGKRLEENLWSAWGGCPSATYLRHRDPSLAPRNKARLHEAITTLNPDMALPTPDEEARDPVEADQVYDRVAAWLRNQTRDRKAFPLIASENISYGFRRNLLGIKTWILLASAASVLSSAAAIYAGRPAWAWLAVGLACGGYALLVTKASLKRQSDTYTARLMEAVDVLSGRQGSSQGAVGAGETRPRPAGRRTRAKGSAA